MEARFFRFSIFMIALFFLWGLVLVSHGLYEVYAPTIPPVVSRGERVCAISLLGYTLEIKARSRYNTREYIQGNKGDKNCLQGENRISWVKKYIAKLRKEFLHE